MIKTLKVKKVVIMDFQEPYSVGLANAVEATLKKAGVSTTRLSAPNTTTDYSAFVTKVPSDADIVFFPTQKPGDAQTFAQQLLEQGKKAKVFGSDGSNDSSQFKVPGSYVSNFAPDITGIKADAAPDRRLEEGQPRQVRRLLRPAELRRGADRSHGDLAGLQGRATVPRRAGRAPHGQEGQDQQLDPRWEVPLVDEVERPAEREVLHLPDPVERLVQARQLTDEPK